LRNAYRLLFGITTPESLPRLLTAARECSFPLIRPGYLPDAIFLTARFRIRATLTPIRADTDRLSSVGNTTSGRARVGAIGLRCDLKTKVEAIDFLETVKGARRHESSLAPFTAQSLDLNCCLFARRFKALPLNPLPPR